MRANQKIRTTAKEKGVCLWQIAKVIGINDGNFSRKLREELPLHEQQKILSIIDTIVAEKENTALNDSNIQNG